MSKINKTDQLETTCQRLVCKGITVVVGCIANGPGRFVILCVKFVVRIVIAVLAVAVHKGTLRWFRCVRGAISVEVAAFLLHELLLLN